MLLVTRGLFGSREQARSAIMAGHVFVNGQKADKPGRMVNDDVQIQVRERLPYVSRGGLKLEHAIKTFGLNLRDKVVIDVGASTGGFTDCALQYGARKVYAVDVGYGQLAWNLRMDPRVVVLERTNIRYLSPEQLAEKPDFVLVDVSFISLTKILAKIESLTGSAAEGICLVKPQFEAGREKVGKKGVVRDATVHQEVLCKVCEVMEGLGWQVKGIAYSPLLGPEGNVEFLVYFSKGGDRYLQWRQRIPQVVRQAHATLVGVKDGKA
ncbi:MAG: TlyA family RNA methyltransferase [Desulfotomaculales bacterium]